MTPAQALATATTNAAELLRMPTKLGRIAPGYFADIVAVEGDPLKDVHVILDHVVWVMKGGPPAAPIARRPGLVFAICMTTTRPVALVTGASRGIGRAIALRLARTHHLLLVARDEVRLHDVATEIGALGGSAEVVVLDVSDASQIEHQLGGRYVDVLVHNAGVGVLKPLLELTPAEWQRMMDVNVNALYHVSRALLPGMVARGRGHVVIIGSIAGRSAFVGGAGYATTKHAVMGFAENLMLEVRDAGVKVSVVSPGSVATEFSGRSEPKASAQLLADDAAAAVMTVVDTPPEVLLHRVEVRILSPKRPRE